MIFLALCLVHLLDFTAADELPKVTLPWGTWQATEDGSKGMFYTFKNIRFGEPAIGPNRFNYSLTPNNITNPGSTVMNSSYGPSCMQIKVEGRSECTPPAFDIDQSEDCLFLDVYVPKSAFPNCTSPNSTSHSGIANTPVVVWFFGGAYIFGSKDAFGPKVPFYTGDGLLEAASKIPGDVIFIAGNYRLGAFGWLAGPTMQSDGLPNAGLYDQRLLLEWVRDYIRLFGGDNTKVTAWGESAGAGSILHHLIQYNGTRDPLFSKALLQSPAFQWQWDRSANGTLEQIYQNFTRLSNCASGGMDCLRKADTKTLKEANQKIYDESHIRGLFPVGPAVDDKWLSYLPAVAFTKEKSAYWKNITSMIVSHVYDESIQFVPEWIKSRQNFTQYVKNFISEPGLEKVRADIEFKYPATGWPYYGDQGARVSDVIRDSTFTCNTRQLFDAYSNSTDMYMMQYDVGYYYNAAKHGSDLLPTFWRYGWDLSSFIEKFLCVKGLKNWFAVLAIPKVAKIYQSYLAKHAIFGNPSPDGHNQGNPLWKVATVSKDGKNVKDVLEIRLKRLITLKPWEPTIDNSWTDIINTKDSCDFWVQAAYDVQKIIKKQRQNLEMGIVPTRENMLTVQDPERWDL